MLTKNAFNTGILKLVNDLNSFDYKGEFCKFIVNGQEVGIITPNIAAVLNKYNECFICSDKKVTLNPIFKLPDERTKAVEKVLIDLRQKDLFQKLKGWRDEHFNVTSKYSDTPIFTIERSAASLFGLKQYGCHINGYIKRNGVYSMWIARRSKTKPTYPGMLDNFTAGGLTAGLGAVECAKKELEEEAGLGEDLAGNMRSVGAITYAYQGEEGVSIEGEFVFDIKLPVDFVPENKDGEVEEFYLMSIEEVKEAIISENFKKNSAVVTLHFLIRKGLITPDDCPNYLEILDKLNYSGM